MDSDRQVPNYGKKQWKLNIENNVICEETCMPENSWQNSLRSSHIMSQLNEIQKIVPCDQFSAHLAVTSRHFWILFLLAYLEIPRYKVSPWTYVCQAWWAIVKPS